MKTLYKKLVNAEFVIATTFLMATVFIIFFAAVSRTMGRPITWSWDLALLLFAWSAFLGADIAYREDKLINVDVLFVRLPKNLQKPVEILIYVITFIFLLTMVYLGSKLSISTWYRKFQGIPALSYTWVTLSMPICSFSMIITIGIKVFKRFVLKEEKAVESGTLL